MIAGVVQVCGADEVLLAEFGSVSLAVTVAVLVKQVPLVAGAVPVRVMVKAAAVGERALGAQDAVAGDLAAGGRRGHVGHPGRDRVADGEAGAVAGPVVGDRQRPGDGPTGATVAGPVLVMPRSTGRATQAAPSLLWPATGPGSWTPARRSGAAVGLVTEIW